jgi:small basic protein
MYVAIGCLAGIDSVLGGIRAGLEGKFSNDVFVTGFLSNIVIAFFLAWLGDRIGINLFLAAVLVLGWRVFTNLSLIRRILLTKWQDARERRQARQQTSET